MPCNKDQNLKGKLCLLKIQLNKKWCQLQSLQLSKSPGENDWAANLIGNEKQMLTFTTAQPLNLSLPTVLAK